jgi:hypothetical protein
MRLCLGSVCHRMLMDDRRTTNFCNGGTVTTVELSLSATVASGRIVYAGAPRLRIVGSLVLRCAAAGDGQTVQF